MAIDKNRRLEVGSNKTGYPGRPLRNDRDSLTMMPNRIEGRQHGIYIVKNKARAHQAADTIFISLPFLSEQIMPPGWCAPKPLMKLEQVIFPLLLKPDQMIALA